MSAFAFAFAIVLAILAGATLIYAALRHGSMDMSDALKQVEQGLAGAMSAALSTLKADIELAAKQLGEKNARIAELEAQVAALTAQQAPTGTSDAELNDLDAELKAALDKPTEPPVTA